MITEVTSLIFYILFFDNRYNMTTTTKFLIERGADPTVPNNYGITALHFAARTGNSVITRMLLELPYANVNKADATGLRVLEIFKYLLI